MKVDLLKFVILGLISVLLAGVTVSPGLITTSAQSRRAKSQTQFQYAAKFICGNFGPGEIVSPGIYFTEQRAQPIAHKIVAFTKIYHAFL
jgi:hypothetical protein